MNRPGLLFFLIISILGGTTLWAENVTEDEPIKSEFPTATPSVPVKPPEEKLLTFAISPLFAVPVSSKTATEYNIGGGLEIYISFKASENFLIGLDMGLQDYSINNDFFLKTFQQSFGIGVPVGIALGGDFTYFPLMAMAKVSFGEDDKLKPYMLFGVGPAFNTASASASYLDQRATATASETSLVLAPGFGVAFRPADDLEAFIQARIDIDFTSQNNSDAVILNQSGASPLTTYGNLSDDGPTFFIPIQAGIRFL
jgi:hypothetical protein